MALLASVLRRVLRGGSWNNKPNNLRSANRNRNNATNRNNNNGFRLVQYAFCQSACLYGGKQCALGAHEVVSLFIRVDKQDSPARECNPSLVSRMNPVGFLLSRSHRLINTGSDSGSTESDTRLSSLLAMDDPRFR